MTAHVLLSAAWLCVIVCQSSSLLAERIDPEKYRELAEENKRLGAENKRLKAEIEEMKRTRMLVPNLLNGDGSVVIGDRHYWLEYYHAGKLTGNPNLIYARWKKSTFGINPLNPEERHQVDSEWPVGAVTSDKLHGIVLNRQIPCLPPRAVGSTGGRVPVAYSSEFPFLLP